MGAKAISVQSGLSISPYALACFLFLSAILCGAVAASDTRLFPVGVFYPENPKADSAKAKMYSDYLTALNEPSLLPPQDDAVQSYRFLWLRSFHHPVAVRVLINPFGGGTVITKVCDGSGGFKPGKLTVDRIDFLSPEAVTRLNETIERLGFWDLPRDNTLGLDGAVWLIEGVKDGKYHLIDYWSPKNGPVRKLGLYFVREVAKLKISDSEIY